MKKTFDASRNIKTPVGVLGLRAQGGSLAQICFSPVEEMGEDIALDIAAAQLREYFCGRRRSFDVPICAQGTDFQMRVWSALLQIPYGETRAYSEIALAINAPRAVRAVGMANHVNPLPIIIPCHRVVGKDGSLTGYAGGLEMKKWLLEIERLNK